MQLKNRQNQTQVKEQPSNQRNKEIISTCLTIGFIVLAVVAIVGGSYLAPKFEDIVNFFKSYDEYVEKVNYIDEENDIAVLTYPSFLFRDEEEMKESVKTLKDSDGVKKILKNEDESITAVMSVKRYEKIKEAAKYAALSLPYMMISEESAIRDVISNEEFTSTELTINRNSETAEKEISDIVYMISFYHICNMEKDVTFEIKLIDYETGEYYLTEVYNTKREVVSSK